MRRGVKVHMYPSLMHLALLASLLACGGGQAMAEPLIGQAAHEWQADHWLHSKPLTLAGLRGKVVLVRWWTAPGCPYCAATAPALNEFHETYTKDGLVVIGFYHHKSSEPLIPDQVTGKAQRFGFKFPVAIDTDWRTLNDWWLGSGDQKWTSVSFLIDRQGRIRHIHEGGQYPKGSRAYAVMKAKIEELLREPSG